MQTPHLTLQLLDGKLLALNFVYEGTYLYVELYNSCIVLTPSACAALLFACAVEVGFTKYAPEVIRITVPRMFGPALPAARTIF